MSLQTFPAMVYADSTGVLVVLTSLPNKAVTWSITSGDGTLTPLSAATDAQGLAGATYVPGTPNTIAVIQAVHGT